MHRAAHLCAIQPEFAPLIERIGPCTAAVERQPLFAALIRSIAHQQLHGNAARAILGRLVTHGGGTMPAPDTLLTIPDEHYRAFGFSGGKIAAIRAIAAAAQSGAIPDLEEADTLDDEALIARLVPIRGVGRWTVEMLLMATLGRPDILPIDDFGVREGWRLLTAAPAQLKPKALALIGAPWAPYRSTAAWYLWRAADEHKKIKQIPL